MLRKSRLHKVAGNHTFDCSHHVPTSMSDELQQYLRALDEACTGERAPECKSIVNSLSVLSLAAKTHAEKVLSLDLLFSSSNGLVSNIDRLLSKKEMWQAREAMLGLILEIITQVSQDEHDKADVDRLRPHVQRIAKVCFKTVSGDPSNRTKSKALEIFVELLKLKLIDENCSEPTGITVQILVNQFFREINTGKSKLSSGVLGLMLQTLGALSDSHPHYFRSSVGSPSSFDITLANYFMRHLEKQTEKDEEKNALCAGIFNGLALFLNEFSNTIPIEPATRDSQCVSIRFLYQCLKLGLHTEDATRYGAQLAAARLLSQHAALFATFIYDDYQQMVKLLWDATQHTNRDVKRKATSALEAVAGQLSLKLCEHKNDSMTRELFDSFSRWGQQTVQASSASTATTVLDSSVSRRALSVRLLGRLSQALLAYLGYPAYRQFVFTQLNYFDRLFTGPSDLVETCMPHLSHLIASYANFIKFLDLKVEATALGGIVENIIARVLLLYPRVHSSWRPYLHSALLRFLVVLQTSEAIRPALECLITQGLTLTISVLSDEVMSHRLNQAEAHEEYFQLWFQLLSATNLGGSLGTLNCSADDILLTQHSVYHRLMEEVIRLLCKLNVKVKSIVLPNGDVTETEPIMKKDFQLFLNLVAFCQRLLPVVRISQFNQWAFSFCTTITDLSLEHSNISGFYKLMHCAFVLCVKSGYFQQLPDDWRTKEFGESSQHQSLVKDEPMEVSDVEISESDTLLNCVQLARTLDTYLTATTVRSSQFSDELLLSSLRMLLAAPRCLISVRVQVESVVRVLELGLSHAPAAETGLETLEKWILQDTSELTDHVPMVMNALHPYLRNSADNNTAFRVLRFLGRIGGKFNASLAHCEHDQSVMAWGGAQANRQKLATIEYSLHFSNFVCNIHLDRLLPSVCELATSATNRATKLTACEYLHACMIYMISQGENETINFEKLYQQLMPVAFKLAIDVDIAARKMFETLIKQCVRWFAHSRSNRAKNSETDVLLEVISDCVGHESDGALRAFAADCMSEFLKWALKEHVSKPRGAASESPVQASALLQRVYALARHSSPFKRLGAMLTLSKVYREFRESDILIQTHTLELLDHALLCLKLAHSDSNALETAKRATDVVQSLQKIITDPRMGKWKLLLSGSAEGHCANLHDFTAWLVDQLSSPETSYRRCCADLLEKFAPLLLVQKPSSAASKQKSSLAQLAVERAEKKAIKDIDDISLKPSALDLRQWLFEKFLGSKNSQSALINVMNCHSLATPFGQNSDDRSFQSMFNQRNLNLWLSNFSAALDSTRWLVALCRSDSNEATRVLTSSDIVSMLQASNLLNSCYYFLKFVAAPAALLTANQSQHISTWSKSVMTSIEFSEFSKLRLTATTRFFRLLNSLLALSVPSDWLSTVLTENCLSLVFAALLRPSFFDSKVSDDSELAKTHYFQREIANLVDRMQQRLEIRSVAVQQLSQLFHSHRAQFVFSSVQDLIADTSSSLSLLYAYQRLWQSTLLSSSWDQLKVSPAQFAQTIMTSICQLNSVPASQKEVLSQSLRLVFHIGFDSQQLLNLVHNARGHGAVFYQQFKEVIAVEVCSRPEKFCSALASALFQTPVSPLISVLGDAVIQLKSLQQSNPDAAALFWDSLLMNIETAGLSFVSQEKAKNNVFSAPPFDVVTEVLRKQQLLVLEKLLSVKNYNDSCLSVNSKGSNALFCILESCCSMSATVALKSMAIEFFPYAFVARPEETAQVLKNLIALPPFPTHSKDLAGAGAEIRSDYERLLDALLSALVKTAESESLLTNSVSMGRDATFFAGSMSIFRSLLPIFREEQHIFAIRIADSVSSLISSITISSPRVNVVLKQWLLFAFDVFCEESLDKSAADNARRSVCVNLMLPLLNAAEPSVLTEFFRAKLAKIWSIISKYAVIEPANTIPALPAAPSAGYFVGLMELECAYRMLDVCFQHCDKELIMGVVPLKEVLKLSHAHATKAGYRNQSIEWQRAHAAAFNALCRAAVKTQTKESFFTSVLFTETPAKSIAVYDHIVDCTVPLKFEVETNFRFSSLTIAKHRQQFTSFSSQNFSPVRYISSQYLTDSSLSQDIAHSSLAESDQMDVDVDASNQLNIQSQQVAPAPIVAEQEIELDVLNTNPCIDRLIDAIQFLHKLRVEAGTSGSPAEFMPLLLEKLKSSATPLQIRWLIVKLVLRCPKVFEPFASSWFPAIVNLACADNNGCVGFAYILRDIATLFVSVWQSFVPSVDDFVQRTSASEFVSKLILLTPYEGDESKSLILKTNLAFVKSLVEKWRALLQLSKDPISQLLRSGAGKPRLENSDRTNVQTGLQLLGLLVAQNFPLCDERVDAPGTAEVLFDLLVLRLKGTSKPLYEASSDVVGMILSNQGSQFANRLSAIRDLLHSFGMSKEVDKFLRCTQKISSFFPLFLNRKLVSQVVSLSINIHGEPLEFAVKIICQYAAQFQKFKQTGFPANENHYEVDMFVPEIRPCVPNTLRSKNPAAQIVILEMLKSHLSNELSGQDLEAWLPHVCTLCEENSNVNVRTLGFQWLMWAYDNRLDRLSSAVAEQVRSALLCGLKDSASSVQQLLFAFWDHSTRLPDSLDVRFQASLQRLHNPKHEQDWVSNCSALLLAPCTRTPMFTQPFAARPLKVRNDRAEDIEMSDISGDIEMQDTMAPLFSRSSQSQRAFNGGSQHTDSLGSFVPMTQYQWSQTQMVEGSQADQRPNITTAANLMQSFDVDRMVFSQDMGGGAGFSIGSQLSQQRPSSSQISANPAAAGANSDSQLCRRFAKRESGKVLAMRFADERARMNRIFAERQQQQKRQTKVDLLRRYRTGEVPDIEIKHSELIQPLLNLQSEPQIAVITLMMLYDSFFRVLADFKLMKKEEVASFKSNLRNGIFQLLQASPCVSTDFVTVLQRMCLLLEPDIKDLTAFPVQLIADTALRSQSSATAVLLLEQHLPRCEPRTKRDDSTRQSLVLSQLARLYSTLGDSDMVLGVYERACTQTITKEAIALTYQQDFSEAFNLFEQASQWAVEGGHQWEQVVNPPQFEVDIWERERMECFRRLGQWNNVAENVLINVDNDPVQLWQPTPDRDFSTRLLLDASLHNSKYQDQALMLVDHVQADREVLESVGGAALVLLESIKRPNRAPMAASRFYQRTLAQWSSTSPLAVGARSRLLAELQPVVEAEEFLSVLRRDSWQLSQAQNLLLSWMQRWPSLESASDSGWDAMLTARLQWLSMAERASNHADQEALTQLTAKCRIESLCVTADAYVAAKNLKLAALCLNTAADANSANNQRIMLVQTKVKLQQAIGLEDPAERIKDLNRLSSVLDSMSFAPDQTSALLFDYYSLTAKVKSNIAELLHDTPDLAAQSGKRESDWWTDASLSLSNSVAALDPKKHQIKSEFASSIQSSNPQNRLYSSANLDLTRFCLDRLLQTAGDNRLAAGDQTEMAFTAMRCLFQASQFGCSRQVINVLPQIIALLDFDFVSKNQFAQEFSALAAQSPSWVFLKWIPQLLSVLTSSSSKQCVDAAGSCIERLVQDYPRAIFFPFQLSIGNSANLSAAATSWIANLTKSLDSSCAYLHAFVTQLDQIGYAHLRLRDLWNSCKNINSSKLLPEKEKSVKVADLIEEFETKFLDNTKSAAEIGRFNVNFIRAYLSSFSPFGKRGAKVRSGAIDLNTVDQTLKQLSEQAARQVNDFPNRENLVETAPLLARYEKFMKLYPDAVVEIPGQYTGTSRPEPALHVRIVGFQAEVSVMKSLRKPKAVTALGDDQKEYKLLIKTGEDLRLDERVEDLFGTMNEIFGADPTCRRRRLRLQRYTVTPLTSTLGVLSWLPDSSTLDDLISDQNKAALSECRTHWEAWVKKQWQFIGTQEKWKRFKPSDDISAPLVFIESLRYVNAQTLAEKLRETEAMLPSDTLKLSLQGGCASAEAFLSVRRTFGSSFATLSMAAYICGIGDRHLGNWMYMNGTGELAAIDFGAAFGLGINLPVPELMPFRLTNQLRSFFAPLDTVSLLKHDMIHALSALRRGRAAILPTFSVFVHEPIAEWAEAGMIYQSGGDDEFKTQWYPRQKVHFTKQKLLGFNPAAVMVEEMKATSYRLNGHVMFPKICELVMGDKNSRRRQLPQNAPLSVSDQVDLLIEQSTDPNVVGRVFGGWSPFI